MIREAKRTAPSIVYVPHIHLWWEIVGPTLRATFTTLLQNIPSFAPVLLLATSDKPHSTLPEEVICGRNHYALEWDIYNHYILKGDIQKLIRIYGEKIQVLKR